MANVGFEPGFSTLSRIASKEISLYPGNCSPWFPPNFFTLRNFLVAGSLGTGTFSENEQPPSNVMGSKFNFYFLGKIRRVTSRTFAVGKIS